MLFLTFDSSMNPEKKSITSVPKK